MKHIFHNVKHIFHNDLPTRGGIRKVSERMIAALPSGTVGSIASLSVESNYQGNHDRKSKLCIILLTWRYMLHM